MLASSSEVHILFFPTENVSQERVSKKILTQTYVSLRPKRIFSVSFFFSPRDTRVLKCVCEGLKLQSLLKNIFSRLVGEVYLSLLN